MGTSGSNLAAAAMTPSAPPKKHSFEATVRTAGHGNARAASSLDAEQPLASHTASAPTSAASSTAGMAPLLTPTRTLVRHKVSRQRSKTERDRDDDKQGWLLRSKPGEVQAFSTAASRQAPSAWQTNQHASCLSQPVALHVARPSHRAAAPIAPRNMAKD